MAKVLTDDQNYYDIADAIREKTGGTDKMEPDEMAPTLRAFNIELEEAYVTPTSEPQEILPGEGFYGFSKVLVDAAPAGGGSETYPDADGTDFGDDYTEEPEETGRFDYEGTLLPEIPDGDYQIIFQESSNSGQSVSFSVNGISYRVEATDTVSIYAAWGHVDDTDDGNSYAYSHSVYVHSTAAETQWRYKNANMDEWSAWNEMVDIEGAGYIGTLLAAGSRHKAENFSYMIYTCDGIPTYFVGTFATTDQLASAMVSCGPEASEERGDTYIVMTAFAPIIFDGANISTADGSPLTIYQYNATDGDSWVEIGQTDGGLSAEGYVKIWNSHDLLDASGTNVTHEASKTPVAETKTNTVVTPTTRDGTYTIDGNSVNSLVSVAQKITETHNHLTPREAAALLNEYYSSPTAEEEKY